jgi:hypothetical protein
MNLKKMLIPIIGIGITITGVLLMKGNSKTAFKLVKATTETIIEAEKTFGGVPLSKLNELSRKIYHGVKVSIDKNGFLVFHYTSISGKTDFHPRIVIDEFGKLVNLGGHYPGQWWSSADEFVRRANELFAFTK